MRLTQCTCDLGHLSEEYLYACSGTYNRSSKVSNKLSAQIMLA
eukprot:COSAG03_NODE_14917_length_447_cov_0.916667_1_plen_42_part_01